MTKIDLSRFDFNLPNELIAQKPTEPRDHARLLVYDRTQKTITDSYFYDLPKYLEPTTSLVLNNSKVEKCRYRFGKREIFVVDQVNDVTVEALVFPGKQFKRGATLELAEKITATVLEILPSGRRRIQLSHPTDDPLLKKHALTPLPPYIEQDESLSDQYQTVYAKPLGSKAAPTAGLHFTDSLLADIQKKHDIIETTLHVGLGTFAPLKAENIESKSLHSETYELTPDVAMRLNQSKHITAVGTTTTRLLESVKRSNGSFVAGAGSTDIFIQPDDSLNAVDSLITNFHLPKTSLLMLVAAFTGTDELMRIYDHAIKSKYRFYSFGDGMLIR